jgi:glycosyltransferase involved in cell wall biosynthesis
MEIKKNVIAIAYECPFQSDSLLIQALLPNLLSLKGSSYTLVFSPKDNSVVDPVIINEWKKNLPNVVFKFVKRKQILIDFIKLFILLINKINKNETILYSRGYLPGLLTYFLHVIFGCEYIFDPRGILAEELTEDSHGYSKIYIKVINKFEKCLIKHSKQNIFVSNKMHKFYENKHNIVIKNYLVKYNSPDLEKFDIIEIKSIETLVRFVYVGSIVKYQKIEEIFLLLATLKNVNYSMHFYVPDHASNLIKQYSNSYNIPSDIFHLKNYEICKKLKNYHYGFLLRGETFVNLVSSPIKFGEYVASGVRVITTDYVGDYSSFVKFFNIGLIIDIEDLASSGELLKRDIENYKYSPKPFIECINLISGCEK